MTELLDTKVLTQMAGDVGFEVLPQLISVFVERACHGGAYAEVGLRYLRSHEVPR